MPDLLAFAGPVACLVVLGLLVVESGLLVGVVLPGDSLLFGAGLLVGSDRIDVPVAALAACAWLGAVLGDCLGYGVGRRLGRPAVARGTWGRRFVTAAERMYERHGWFAVVICRWFPGVRAVVPTLAGIGRMSLRAFLPANGFGAALWAVGMVLLGHAAAAVPWVRDLALWAMGVSIAITAAYALAAATNLPRRGPAPRRGGRG
ncbi:MAG: DedA family protein [Actinomycetes bacterium]